MVINCFEKISRVRVLSLFDGISCARIALGDRVESYTASEIDEDAIGCSRHNWPDIRHIGSVKDINPSEHSIDLLVGGSPCQDLSSANPKKAGLDGQKSGLFWEYIRVLRGCRPRYFIFENVYSMSPAARDTITRELGVEPLLINASRFSAQSRKRLFWTNIPLTPLPEDRGITLRSIAVVGDQLALENPRLLPAHEFTTLVRPNTGDLHWVGIVRGSMYSTERVYADTGKASTLRCRSREYFQINGVVRQLTITEIERLQSLPDGYTAGMRTRTKRMHAIGNGFNVDVIRWIVSHIP